MAAAVIRERLGALPARFDGLAPGVADELVEKLRDQGCVAEVEHGAPASEASEPQPEPEPQASPEPCGCGWAPSAGDSANNRI